jgi:DNA mismatch repair protein MutS
MDTTITSSTTPLMQQYFTIKKQYCDAFVFFQVGDFYELFFEDAQKAAAILSITLTKRGTNNGEDIPLCGVPVSSIESYTLKLVKQGYTIVICNQTEIAQPGKLVTRAVSSVISPGTLLCDVQETIEAKQYIAFISCDNTNKYIVGFFEYITQKLNIIECLTIQEIINQLFLHAACEVIVDSDVENIKKDIFESLSLVCSLYEKNNENDEKKNQWITYQGLSDQYQSFLNLVYLYAKKYHPIILERSLIIEIGHNKHILYVDHTTQRHLELCENQYDKTQSKTLYNTLNETMTSMGSRLLKEWIMRPNNCYNTILERQKSVEIGLKYSEYKKKLRELLFNIGDLERISGRIILKKPLYRDYQKLVFIKKSFNEIKNILELIILNEKESLFNAIYKGLLLQNDFFMFLEKYIIIENNTVDVYINYQSDKELQTLHNAIYNQSAHIIEFEQKENEKYKTSEIKIKHTPLYGYVFEISKARNPFIPDCYKRVQTLTNRERYISDELKLLEHTIVYSQKLYKEREKKLYCDLQEYVFMHSEYIQQSAFSLSLLDVILTFSYVSEKYFWIKPIIDYTSKKCEIIEGKHPVIAPLLKHNFVSNSLIMNEEQKSWIITGPNMGGKSTFMKQNALIILLSHIGSYVPVKSAIIPLVDAIYTRMGATDYISEGKSTFYVEMEEAAKICNTATNKTFVLLDEIGRGTSTYDGMALAGSIVDFLHEYKKSFLLFATHYHEIDTILDSNKYSWYYPATVVKSNSEIVLLYTLKKGKSIGSMGIEIASKAQLPEIILFNAYRYKNQLECNNNNCKCLKTILDENNQNKYVNMEYMCNQIKHYDMDEISPRQAYDLLVELKQKII